MRRPDPLTGFDPVALARYERDAWATYYLHDWRAFLGAAVGMVEQGFGMPRPQTVYGAGLVLRANMLWAPYPDNDAAGALACMRRFYDLVVRTTGETFGVDEAARLEIEWWRVHRWVQREDGPPDELVAALSALGGHVYRVPADAVADSARLRAEAMSVSDEWVEAGCRPDDPRLDEELALLVASYTALHAAVT